MEEIMDVLLIESRAKSACTIQAMLEDCHDLFRREWTYSLAEAVEMLGEQTFDCIISNVMLSEGGGKEVIETLVTRAPTTPVIALIEQGTWELGRDMLAVGAQDFLIKDKLSPELLRKSILYSIERQRLMEDVRSLTTRDELTGLYNRRGFKQLSEHQLNMSKRSQRPATMLFVDLDNLKQVNDKQGHPVGDLAICETADILRKLLRTTDVIGRLGGDEFIVLMPDTANGAVENALVRLQEMLDERNVPTAQYQLSASVGYVTYDGSGDYNIDSMIESACHLMYNNKNAKKNQQGE